ncbi:MAG TPA: outer membrane protein assembly factor BamD, partial [Polyangiaceae bacterium]
GSTVAAPPVEARATASSSVAAFPVADARGASRALEEEAALLRRARSELRGGRLAEAFATLEASRERFSLPELAQEREALLIELLYRSGEPARAAEKARSFLSRYPESPHAAKLRSIAAPAGAR